MKALHSRLKISLLGPGLPRLHTEISSLLQGRGLTKSPCCGPSSNPSSPGAEVHFTGTATAFMKPMCSSYIYSVQASDLTAHRRGLGDLARPLTHRRRDRGQDLRQKHTNIEARRPEDRGPFGIGISLEGMPQRTLAWTTRHERIQNRLGSSR